MPKRNLETQNANCGDCHYCFCLKKITKYDEFSNCQDHLKNWEEWIKRRKEVSEKLSQSLGRPHGELIMNLCEEHRYVQEDKTVFEYTRINTNFDKLRGNPEFWKLPVGLIDRCDPSLDPIYFTVKSKPEKNEIPIIEYVGTANYILNEKNVLPRTRNLYKLWKDCKYRTDQLRKLSSSIALIEPHRPDHEELILVGQKIAPKEDQQIKEASPRGTNDICVPCVEITSIPKICFMINGTKISKGDELVNKTIKIRLVFECSNKMTTPIYKFLKFENRGLSAIRFYWHPVERFQIFRDILKKDCEYLQPFYFNKCELLLTPGKEIQFPVWFKVNTVGNYYESWEIETVPRFWSDDFHLAVSLQGFVSLEGFEETKKNIKQNLDDRVRGTLIRDLVNNIFNKQKYTASLTVTWSFTEEQLFESANQEIWGVEKRSKYLYNEAVVKELKQLYKEVRHPDNFGDWNYSIKELKIMTRKKDIMDYVENKIREARKARERRMELRNILKEQTEMSIAQKQPVLTTKTKPAVSEVPQEDKFQLNETRSNKLEKILQELERPLMIKNKKREKYFTAFIIMRTYIFKMCDALENNYVPENSNDDACYPSYNYRKVTSIEQLPRRLVFESFDDIWVRKTKRIPPECKLEYPVLPKPEILKDVPADDAKKLYKTYFNIPDTPPETKGKGKDKKGDKGKKEDKGKKGKDAKTEKGGAAGKQKKGDPKAKAAPPRVITVREDFHPYAEEYIPSAVATSSEDLPSNQVYINKTDYDYQKYLIVYTHLSQAVEAMVDALETFKENVVSVDMLSDLTKCTSLDTVKEAPVDLKEELSSETEISSRESEDDLYFQYLLDTHLNKNINTKKYIVHGRTKPSDQDYQSTIAEEQEPESLPNLFKSHDTSNKESFESGTESVEIQTSDVEEDYKVFSNMLLHAKSLREVEDSEDKLLKTLPGDIFYYLGNDDYNEVTGESKKSDDLAV